MDISIILMFPYVVLVGGFVYFFMELFSERGDLSEMPISPLKKELMIKVDMYNRRKEQQKWKCDVSPMRVLARKHAFLLELAARCNQLYQQDHARLIHEVNTLLWITPKLEQQCHYVLSASFRRVLKNSIFLPKLAMFNRREIASMFESSPMRKFIVKNQDELVRVARQTRTSEPHTNYYLEIKRLSPVVKELAKTYPAWETRLQTIRHCLQHSIPIVELLPGHTTHINITSNQPIPCLDGIEGIEHYQLFTGKDTFKHVYNSQCPVKTNRNIIVNAVSALKNMIQETPGIEALQPRIQVISNSDNIYMLNDTKPTHQVVITVIRRSKALFTEALFKQCLNIVQTHIKANSNVVLESGTMESWLSSVLQFKFETNAMTLDQFRKLTLDVIPKLNLTKDVIFASRTVGSCWIRD
jgi:hypothetical protein